MFLGSYMPTMESSSVAEIQYPQDAYYFASCVADIVPTPSIYASGFTGSGYWYCYLYASL
jgi:hypothetical protein